MTSARATHLRELADRVASSRTLVDAVAHDVAAAIVPHLGPGETLTAQALASTDHVLHLVDRASPGWSIQLRGVALEPDGHWHCSIRPSEVRDEAEMMGIAKGPDLSNTVLAALLRLLAYRVEKSR
jgi:hypothetical protein